MNFLFILFSSSNLLRGWRFASSHSSSLILKVNCYLCPPFLCLQIWRDLFQKFFCLVAHDSPSPTWYPVPTGRRMRIATGNVSTEYTLKPIYQFLISIYYCYLKPMAWGLQLFFDTRFRNTNSNTSLSIKQTSSVYQYFFIYLFHTYQYTILCSNSQIAQRKEGGKPYRASLSVSPF